VRSEDSLKHGTPRSRSRILITGPGGRVGSQIVPLLRQEFALRLLDLKPSEPQDDDETLQGDIRDLPFLRQACEGVSALVHLAAVPDEDDFYSRLLPMNLAGAYNAFEAARLAGVPKVIFASTGQTVRHYPHGQRVSPDMLARPVTVYACTKLFGEALGRYYADAHGLSVICIRICWFQPYSSPLLQTETGYRQEWCSPRDLTQLIVKSIRASLKFAIFFGISDNAGRTWDISNAQRLVGYAPEDRIAAWMNG
jgi:uronate dehydrogenase